MNVKKSWVDIVKNSNNTPIHPVQYVKSNNEPNCKNEPKCKNNFVNKIPKITDYEVYQGPMTKETVFENICCWGEHELLFPLIDSLTIDEINLLINHIDYKLNEIDGWSNPERDSDRTKDLEKCKIILIKKKIKFISKS